MAMRPRNKINGKCFKFLSSVKNVPLNIEERPFARTPFFLGLVGFGGGGDFSPETGIFCSFVSVLLGISLNLFGTLIVPCFLFHQPKHFCEGWFLFFVFCFCPPCVIPIL